MNSQNSFISKLSGLSETNRYVSDSDAPKDAKRPLSKKLSNAEKKVEKAISFVESGRSKQANTQLNAASNVLGAVLNYLGGKQNGGKTRGNDKTSVDLPEDFARKVTQEVEGIIDLLADAREAQI